MKCKKLLYLNVSSLLRTAEKNGCRKGQERDFIQVRNKANVYKIAFKKVKKKNLLETFF